MLNERLIRGKGTGISTNLDLTELKGRYTERFTSRFLSPQSCLELPFLGVDMRLNAPGN